jgi:hypothetical protein
MKKFLLFFILCISLTHARAQEIKTDVAYNYLFAKQWDKIIQTYNYSRPFLANKQPLLMHGLQASITFTFQTDKKIQHGLNLAYAYTRSLAENENFVNKLNLHFLNLGYVMHFENPEKTKHVYADFLVGATSSALFRNVNGEAFVVDDERAKAFGIGGSLGFKLGYSLPLKNNSHVSPFVALGLTPYLYAPKTESVINQTSGLVARNWAGILSLQIGFAFHIRQTEAS